MTYEKAVAELVEFDNNDVIATSGGCGSWSNQNNVGCYYGQTATGSGGPGAPLD